MKEQFAIQNLLRARLAEIQASNPRYSLRAYSKKVGVHVGALTCIINGKRNVSRTLAERIAQRLMLDPQERSELLSLFPERRRYRKQDESDDGSSAENEARYLRFSASQYRVTAEWEHLAVMSLLNCADFQSDVEWIAARLGITEPRARQVVDRLIDLELLNLNSDGKLSRSKKNYRTSDDVADISIKRHHEQSFELAKESLHRDSVSCRDFTSITMAIDKSKLSAAKEIIRKCEDDLSDLLGSGHQTEVYRFSAQLFPLSKLKMETTK